jgi:hypothetical protein
MVIRILRQTAFLTTGLLLRLPLWGCLWALGKTGFVKVIFQVYPSSERETRAFCPNIPLVRNFFSARPTLAGIITCGFRPLGIYMVIPNTVEELAKGENKHLALKVIERLQWVCDFTGATSVGLAGQLPGVFERRHGIMMKEPLHGSLFGMLFSLLETTRCVIEAHEVSTNNLCIGMLGTGDLATALSDSLEHKGHRVVPIDLRHTSGGEFVLRHESLAVQQLKEIDILINLMPAGKHFLQLNCHEHLSPECGIIDFAHPGIPPRIVNATCMGNRVQRDGLRFLLSLPGGWKSNELPACSLPSILAAMTNRKWNTFEEFSIIARETGFYIPLNRPPLKVRGRAQAPRVAAGVS